MSLRLRARPNGFIEPCLPSAAPKPPAGDGWIHEIKHDGFRLMAQRDGAGVRLFTRRGLDWTDRYPSIAAAVAALACRSCLIDGEVVICGEDGTPVFDRLRYGRQPQTEARLFAFDLLELGGKDLRRSPLEERKRQLAKLLRKASRALHFNEHIDDEPGDVVFRHACQLGLEGIVSKRLGSPYHSGRTRYWIKSKNPAAPSVKREAEEDWSKKRWRSACAFRAGHSVRNLWRVIDRPQGKNATLLEPDGPVGGCGWPHWGNRSDSIYHDQDKFGSASVRN
jgi:bifunctional non-homologous end joining protein LigD